MAQKLTKTPHITFKGTKKFDLYIISGPNDYALAATIMKMLEKSEKSKKFEELEEPEKKRDYDCCHIIRDCSPGENRSDW